MRTTDTRFFSSFVYLSTCYYKGHLIIGKGWSSWSGECISSENNFHWATYKMVFFSNCSFSVILRRWILQPINTSYQGEKGPQFKRIESNSWYQMVISITLALSTWWMEGEIGEKEMRNRPFLIISISKRKLRLLSTIFHLQLSYNTSLDSSILLKRNSMLHSYSTIAGKRTSIQLCLSHEIESA